MLNILHLGGDQPGKKEILKACDGFFTESKKALDNRREKWKNHYSAWCNTRISESRPRFRSTTRVNYCWITTQVKIPIILASNPTVNFVPFNKEEKYEIAGQKLSKTVGRYLYSKLDLRGKLVDALLDAEIYDAGFWKIGFSPSENNGKGEVFVSPIDVFKLFPDPLARSMDSLRFMCHLEIYPVSMLKKRYDEYKDHIKPDESVSEFLYEDRLYQERKPRVRMIGDTESTKMVSERAFQKEFWIAPVECDQDIKTSEEDVQKYPGLGVGEPLYKYGRVVKVINDRLVVDDRPYLYKHGKPPYVQFISNKVSNEFWGMGDIEQIIPLNDTLNHRIQQLEDIANKCANLGYTISPKAGKKAIKQLQKYGLTPGLIKVMEPGMLVPDQMPQVPQYLFEEIKQLLMLIERVNGIGDVTQGRGDVRQRTARGIERLYEAAQTRIGLSIKHFEDSFKDAAFQMGSLVRQFYKEERSINIAGNQNYRAESFTLKPEELEEEVEISIDSAAALPQDKQSRAQLIFELLKNKIFDMAVSPDPGQKEIAKIVLEGVEFPGREALLNFSPQQMQAPGMPSMPGAPNQMPEAAPGVPALSPGIQEMAQAAGISPEQLAQIVQQGMGVRPTP